MKSVTVLACLLAAAAAAPQNNRRPNPGNPGNPGTGNPGNPGSGFNDSPGRGAPFPTPADTPECAMAKILAQSIEVNILIQMQEQIRTDDVFVALTQGGGNLRQFEIAKANLIDTVQSGIAVRETNQLIIPPGNPASEGIALVAAAQVGELRRASSLIGDPNEDVPSLEALQRDFADGIRQNQLNQQAALSQCR
ncbi:hypothetical protein F5X68DRAFT_230307 [Plectosphaerella plurivora]|uniref:Uncharacterized protein n=1 Tax=Plectosphaerella plurivora TaxID=936078 RepID=A0A9P8VGM9_9PEZI|nr:hypothetical protein F5X68DRAFT_230307 [Plectosphaerella plurivora]